MNEISQMILKESDVVGQLSSTKISLRETPPTFILQKNISADIFLAISEQVSLASLVPFSTEHNFPHMLSIPFVFQSNWTISIPKNIRGSEELEPMTWTSLRNHEEGALATILLHWSCSNCRLFFSSDHV